MYNLAILAEIEEDKRDLKSMNLSQEEIDGYIDFFIENYFKENKTDGNLRLQMQGMRGCSRDLAQEQGCN